MRCSPLKLIVLSVILAGACGVLASLINLGPELLFGVVGLISGVYLVTDFPNKLSAVALFTTVFTLTLAVRALSPTAVYESSAFGVAGVFLLLLWLGAGVGRIIVGRDRHVETRASEQAPGTEWAWSTAERFGMAIGLAALAYLCFDTIRLYGMSSSTVINSLRAEISNGTGPINLLASIGQAAALIRFARTKRLDRWTLLTIGAWLAGSVVLNARSLFLRLLAPLVVLYVTKQRRLSWVVVVPVLGVIVIFLLWVVPIIRYMRPGDIATLGLVGVLKEIGQVQGSIAQSISSTSMDGLDGLTLAIKYESVFPRRQWWMEVLAPLWAFIPRGLWSTKPDFVDNLFTQQVLGWQSGGKFLSLPGHLLIAYGNAWPVVAALIGTALVTVDKAMARAAAKSASLDALRSAFLSVFIVRLALAGGTYDLFNFLMFVLSFLAVVILQRLLLNKQGGRKRANVT